MSTIKFALEEMMGIDGAQAASIVDANSGMILGSAGAGVDIEIAAAGNTQVVRSTLKTMQSIGSSDFIEDILITLGNSYHVIRPMAKKEAIFLYAVLDKSKANLALARRKILEIEKNLDF